MTMCGTLAEELDSRPQVVSLDPTTVGEVLGDARTLARATGTRDAAVDAVGADAGADRSRPRDHAAARRDPEWPRWSGSTLPSPPGIGRPSWSSTPAARTSWAFPGEHSEERTWDEIRAAQPNVVIVMPCGYDAPLAYREAEMHQHELATLGAGQIVAVDAAAYFSRPGPRIVAGLELLAHILHPDVVPGRARAGAQRRALRSASRRAAAVACGENLAPSAAAPVSAAWRPCSGSLRASVARAWSHSSGVLAS